MDGKLTVSRDEHGRQILDADARSAGHDDDVRAWPAGAARMASGVIAHEPGKVDDRAVALRECREHRSVGVGDMKALRLRAGRATVRCR